MTDTDGTLERVAVTANSLALGDATLGSEASGLAAELGHEGTAAAGAPGEALVPLTARFENVPAAHDGESVFTIELRFSEDILGLSYVTVRDSALEVGNAQVMEARRLTRGSNRDWEVTVEPASNADVTRVRLGLEGAWHGLGTGGGGALTPRLEVGLRHDGGDAETGVGADVGAGVEWSAPASGLSGELSARGLLTHEAHGFRGRGIAGSLAWDPRPESSRGFSASLRQTMGAQASGGMDTLLGRETMADLGRSGATSDRRRLELELGYGFGVFDDRFTATPEAGLALSDGHHEMSLGWRLALERSDRVSLELGLEATRSEATSGEDDPENALRLRIQVRF